MTGFALSKSMVMSCAILFVSGAAMMGVFSMISSLVQLITANEMRGRVMSVYNVAFRGGMPLGSIVTGYLVPIYSAPHVLAVNGLLLSRGRMLLPAGAAARGRALRKAARATELWGRSPAPLVRHLEAGRAPSTA